MRLQERVSGTGSTRQRSHKSSGTLWCRGLVGRGERDDKGEGKGEEGAAVMGKKEKKD